MLLFFMTNVAGCPWKCIQLILRGLRDAVPPKEKVPVLPVTQSQSVLSGVEPSGTLPKATRYAATLPSLDVRSRNTFHHIKNRKLGSGRVKTVHHIFVI